MAGHDTAGIAPLVARIGQIPRGADSLALYYRIQGIDTCLSTASSLLINNWRDARSLEVH